MNEHTEQLAPAAQAPPAGERPLTVRDVVSLYQRHSEADGIHGAEARAERERIFALTDFIQAHPGWRSSSTRRAKANAIRAAFQWACDQERIARHPFRRVRYTEAERRPELPDDTLQAVLELSNKRFERACRFLRLTGCRLSELCAAAWPDMDLERRIWTIPGHKSRKTTRKAKVVALVPEAVELLQQIRRTQREGYTGSVFLNNRGTPWNRRTLGQQLARTKKRYGIKTAASLHGIRHAAATAAIVAGAPIKLISEQLGHSSVVVTERYYFNKSEGHIDAIGQAFALGLPAREASHG